MDGRFKVSLEVVVEASPGGEVVESEKFYFDGLTFASMSFYCSEFFELIKRLQKAK